MAVISLAMLIWQELLEWKYSPTHETPEREWARSMKESVKPVRHFLVYGSYALAIFLYIFYQTNIFFEIWGFGRCFCWSWDAYLIFYRRNGHLDQP